MVDDEISAGRSGRCSFELSLRSFRTQISSLHRYLACTDIWSMCGHSLRSVFYSSPTSAGKDKPVVCSFLTWHTGVALSSINCLDRINRPSALTEVFEGRDLGRSMNFCITFELPRACYQSAACRWNWTGNHHNYIELPSLATINGASRVLCTLRIMMKDTEKLIHCI